MRLEGLGKLKKSTSSGLNLVTFQLVAWFLNQLRYRVPQCFCRDPYFQEQVSEILLDQDMAQSMLAQVVTFLTSIQKVPGSNLDRNIDYPD
jgi:hypothetical protein